MNYDDYTWPRKGDRLFKPDEDWMFNARINIFGDKLSIYADGYKKAGDIIVDYLKDDGFEIDLIVYPIVFLYRQYIELRLKEIIREGKKLLDEKGDYPKHHKILYLWKEARDILVRVWPKGPKEDLEAVESVLKQFAEKDPDSVTFRYDEDKKGKSTTKEIDYINVRNLKNVIDRIAGLLDGSALGISAFFDEKKSIESDFRHEY